MTEQTKNKAIKGEIPILVLALISIANLINATIGYSQYSIYGSIGHACFFALLFILYVIKFCKVKGGRFVFATVLASVCTLSLPFFDSSYSYYFYHMESSPISSVFIMLVNAWMFIAFLPAVFDALFGFAKGWITVLASIIGLFGSFSLYIVYAFNMFNTLVDPLIRILSSSQPLSISRCAELLYRYQINTYLPFYAGLTFFFAALLLFTVLNRRVICQKNTKDIRKDVAVETASYEQELKSLMEDYNNGTITEEEYAAQRAAILERL